MPLPLILAGISAGASVAGGILDYMNNMSSADQAKKTAKAQRALNYEQADMMTEDAATQLGFTQEQLDMNRQQFEQQLVGLKTQNAAAVSRTTAAAGGSGFSMSEGSPLTQIAKQTEAASRTYGVSEDVGAHALDLQGRQAQDAYDKSLAQAELKRKYADLAFDNSMYQAGNYQSQAVGSLLSGFAGSLTGGMSTFLAADKVFG